VADKRFKDPIYGYIEIDKDLVDNIIDTPAFQRLKDIRQTSYAPLYPSAYHNRYAHSLGVYHLGKLAFSSVKSQLQKRFHVIGQNSQEEETVTMLQKIFELACLLHDVGHAPFSHTGETFYLDSDYTLYQNLKKSVDESSFCKDFDDLGTNKPAPHECMSCVVGLKTFATYFNNEQERGLFARCIIGMPFQFRDEEPKHGLSIAEKDRKQATEAYNKYLSRKKTIELFNCVIGLLNSSIIDVDRLDYIIRDSETIGFQNVQVDYMRLLGGLHIVEYENKLCVGYHKSALSVIESAVYAHDAEKKWVQSHPAILYEMEALKNAMASLTVHFTYKNDTNPIFCFEALTAEGKQIYSPTSVFSDDAKSLLTKKNLFSNNAQTLIDQERLFAADYELDKETGTLYRKYPLALLADEDILYMMKRFCKDELGFEYFARNQRRLAVWKSEAEFRALFQEQIGEGSKIAKRLEQDFEALVNYCLSKTGSPIVGEWIFSTLGQEEQDAKQAIENSDIPESDYKDIMDGIQAKRNWATALKEIANNLNIEFDFLILFQKKFSSSFKPTLGKIPIYFPNVKDGVVPLENVIDVLRSSADHKSNFFHLFYKPKGAIDGEMKAKIVQSIAEMLIVKANY